LLQVFLSSMLLLCLLFLFFFFEFKRCYVWLVTSFSELYAFVVFVVFVLFFVQKLNVYSEWSTPTSTRVFRLA